MVTHTHTHSSDREEKERVINRSLWTTKKWQTEKEKRRTHNKAWYKLQKKEKCQEIIRTSWKGEMCIWWDLVTLITDIGLNKITDRENNHTSDSQVFRIKITLAI